jgi:8-oxo-dGTP diphosphatase
MHYRSPVAAHVFFLVDGKLLMLRRVNTGFEDGKYSVIAGHVEEGESVTEAALREITEETGVSVKKDDLKIVSVMHRKAEEGRVDYFFTVSRWDGEIQNAEPGKCDDLRWFELEDLPEQTIPYIRRGIDNLKNGRVFDEFGW